MPAALGPPTWKESCCSPPLPRNLSAKVRGAHAVYPYPLLGTEQSDALAPGFFLLRCLVEEGDQVASILLPDWWHFPSD